MQPAPIPANETERLADLASLELLDTEPEARFDDLTRLAAKVLSAAVAKVNLVDRDRQWAKSITLETGRKESERTYGTCAHAIESGPVMVVPDLRADPRFHGRPDVMAEPDGWRAYASVVLHGPRGLPVGTFCVMDRKPREFSDKEICILRQLAEIAQNELLRTARERQLAASAVYFAQVDTATGLPNRRRMLDELRRLIGAAEPRSHLALLLLEIDRFDRLAHTRPAAEIDRALKLIGERIGDCAGAAQVVGRVGERQFLVLMPGNRHSGQALFLANRLGDALSRPLGAGLEDLRLNARIGISVWPADGEEPEALLRNAEVALDHARASAGSVGASCFFSPQMNERLNHRLGLELDLYRALARREFRLHYQPKVNLADGRVIGAEALLRWTSATRGEVPPAEFVPVAEEAGLMPELGQWVIQAACRQLRLWLDAGFAPPPVAVNVSERQIRTGAVADLVLGALESNALPTALLAIEVTESSFVADLDAARVQLQQLARAGIGIALDDFGTGFSSLSYLQKLPVDTLKIDRSFVRDFIHNPRSAAIIGATVGMARAMALKLVGEGIETEEQRRALAEIGCELGQGYLFGHPEAADRFERRLPKAAAAGRRGRAVA